MNLPIAVELASLRQPFKMSLETAAKLGARGVEIDARNELRPQDLTQTGLRQIRKWLEDLNLKVSAVNFPTRRGYDVQDDLEARIAGTKAAFRLARNLGCGTVVNAIGKVPSQESSSWGLLMEVLTDLGNAGHHVGAFLAARTGSDSGADLARLISALPEGTLGVDFDPGNLIMGGFSASEALAVLGPHVLHVHAHDAVRDLAIGRGIETQVGRGSADFPAVFGLLEEYHYRGWVTITRRGSESPVREMADAISFLRAL